MNKKIISLAAPALLLQVVAGASNSNAVTKEAALPENKKPNIVFIIADDLGYSDVSYMNMKPEIQTPNIDELSKSGITFMDAYAAAPVSSPTRASIMTGKSPATEKITCHIPAIGIDKYDTKMNKGRKLKEAFFIDHLPKTETTVAEVLKSEGYKTGYFGKWHLGGEGSWYSKDGIINSEYNPDKYGYDVNIGGCAYGQPASYFSPYKNGTLKDGPKGEYLTDRLGEEAVKFIKENKDTPFFLNLATYTVHTPLGAPASYVKKFGGNKYFAMINKLDEAVGKVIKTLKENNLLENTIVVFYSDNGGLWGNPPLKGKKGTINEGGLRVPMIISYKGKIKPGQISDLPVTSIDFFPTFWDIAEGAFSDETIKSMPKAKEDSIRATLEGVSLVPLLKGQKRIVRKEFKNRDLYWHFPHHRKEGLSMGAVIREGDWKLIQAFETNKLYLYNIKKDIAEENNLADKYPEKVKDLLSKLKTWQKKVDAEMPQH